MFIREQAEHFFNAFEVLKENDEILIERLSNSSGNRPKEGIFGTRPTMGVGIVCLAFSVELYVKSLHHVLTREVPRGHKISELFKKLPEQYQQEIFSYRSIGNYGWKFSEFEREIIAISDGFEKWRYSHEFTSVGYNTYFALVFIEAIRDVIVRVSRDLSPNLSLQARRP